MPPANAPPRRVHCQGIRRYNIREALSTGHCQEEAGMVRLKDKALRISGMTLLLFVMGLSASEPCAADTQIVLGTENPQEG